jgi:hypothetical protein
MNNVLYNATYAEYEYGGRHIQGFGLGSGCGLESTETEDTKGLFGGGERDRKISRFDIHDQARIIVFVSRLGD